jgi:hypothetical protein
MPKITAMNMKSTEAVAVSGTAASVLETISVKTATTSTSVDQENIRKKNFPLGPICRL